MHETNRTNLPTLIEAAQAAINSRLVEIQTVNGGTGSPAEMQPLRMQSPVCEFSLRKPALCKFSMIVIHTRFLR
jgi:hypothetical protein